MEEFKRQRRTGMIMICLAMPVAVALWLAIDQLMPPILSMENLASRETFALKCWCVAVLFTLVMGVEAVAHERLGSPAFDPLARFETRRLKVNERYLQNTLEQTVVFAAALFGLAAYCPTGSAMRAVVATTVVWVLARFAFWAGYHRSAAMRGLGAPGMALSMIVLVYVTARVAASASLCWSRPSWGSRRSSFGQRGVGYRIRKMPRIPDDSGMSHKACIS
jgi:uncharacterized MAPEG superfamily protein